MSFRWVYRTSPTETSGSSEDFGSQQQAEDFMGAEWRRLLDDGILAATLMDGDRELYTMSLTED